MKRCLPALMVLALPVLAFPGAALAELEIYGGLGTGYSVIEINQPALDVPQLSTSISSNVKGTTLAYKQFVGLRFSPNASVETGFINFGTINDDIPSATSTYPFFETINQGVKTYGYDTYLVGYWPLDNEFELFGKVGMIRWHTNTEYDGGVTTTNDNGDDLAYGFGANFRSAGRLQLRVEAQAYDVASQSTTWSVTMSLIYSLPLGR